MKRIISTLIIAILLMSMFSNVAHAYPWTTRYTVRIVPHNYASFADVQGATAILYKLTATGKIRSKIGSSKITYNFGAYYASFPDIPAHTYVVGKITLNDGTRGLSASTMVYNYFDDYVNCNVYWPNYYYPRG